MASFHFFLRLFGGVILTATILAMPWFYGGVTLFAQKWLSVGILTVALAALPSLFLTPRMIALKYSPGRLVLLGLPWAAALCLGVFQTYPLSESALQTVSPHIPELASELLPAPGSEEEQIERSFFDEEKLPENAAFFASSASVDWSATRDAAAILSLCLLTYLSSGILFRTTREKRLFWSVLTLGGVVLAVFAMITIAAPDGGYWQKFWPSARYGPYVNRNNAAGYFCLCLAPAFALLSAEVLNGRRRIEYSRPDYSGFSERRNYKNLFSRLSDSFFDLVDSFTRQTAFRFGVAAIILAGALSSLSRGGAVAALFMTAVSVVVFTRRGKAGLFSLILWAALAAGLGLIAWSGMTERVTQELGTIFDADEKPLELNGRVDNWTGALQTTREYQFRGSGFGTYATANRQNDFALTFDCFCEYAENFFIDSMVVGGAALLTMLLLGLLIWAVAIRRAIRRPRTDSEEDDSDEDDAEGDSSAAKRDLIWSFGLGVLALFAGQAVAASLDFGLLLPANAVLASAILGSFAAGEKNADSRKTRFHSERFGNVLPAITALFFLASILAAFYGGKRLLTAESVERTVAECSLDTEPKNLDLAAIDLSIAELEKAIQERPDDARLRKTAAEAGITRFRFLFWEQMRSELPNRLPAELWEQTAPEVNFIWIMMLERHGMKVGPQKFRNAPAVAESLRPAMRNLLMARRLEPLDPEIHYLCALITLLTTEVKNPDELLRLAADRAFSVSRYETKVCCQAGLLRYWSGNTDEALSYWRDSLELSRKYVDPILACLNEKKNRKELVSLVDRAFPDDFTRAEYAVTRAAKPEFSETRNALLAKMKLILDRSDSKESAEWFRNSGRWHALAGRADEAIVQYRRALETDKLRSDWNYELGMVFYSQKKRTEAIEALRAAVICSPGNKLYAAALKQAEKLPE